MWRPVGATASDRLLVVVDVGTADVGGDDGEPLFAGWVKLDAPLEMMWLILRRQMLRCYCVAVASHC
jgi:hypothetical protein